MAKECRAPVTASPLLRDAVFGGAAPLDVLLGKVCWPLCCQGRAEGISFPPAQERAQGSPPDLRQLLFPSWDKSNSGLPRRGLSDKLVSTLGRQHLPAGSSPLCSQTPTRPTAALPNRGSRGAAGRGPLQQQMLNHKKGNTLPASLSAVCLTLGFLTALGPAFPT